LGARLIELLRRWLLVIAVASASFALPALAETQAVVDANAGLDALDRNDFPKAERLITKAIAEGGLSQSDLELAYLSRAKAYAGESRSDLALADVAKAIAIDPTDGEAASLKARLLSPPTLSIADDPYCKNSASSDLTKIESAARADIARSIASFADVVAKCPNDAQAHYDLGAAFGYRAFFKKSKDDNRQAFSELSTALQLDPQNAQYLIARANVIKNGGDCPGSFADYNHAIALAPNNAEYVILLGNAENVCGDPDNGLETLKRGISIDPTNYDGHIFLANALAKRERCAEAIPEYTLALQYAGQNSLKQNIPVIYTNRGICYRAVGQHELAVADFRAALEIDPTNWVATANLIQIQ
jgi:tetratricopeptide (TPR) repeat protein